MGTWSLENVSSEFKEFKGAERVGHIFTCVFTLSYHPNGTTIGAGKFLGSTDALEMPHLEWWEDVKRVDFDPKTETPIQWSQFNLDLYARSPMSPTLVIWPRRYIEAYRSAQGRGASHTGSVKLRDVRIEDLDKYRDDKGENEDQKQAIAVQKYLAANGGTMIIVVVDRPALDVRQGPRRRKRRLVFDCGVKGFPSQRIRAYQYLDVTTQENGQLTSILDFKKDAKWPALDHGNATQVKAPLPQESSVDGRGAYL